MSKGSVAGFVALLGGRPEIAGRHVVFHAVPRPGRLPPRTPAVRPTSYGVGLAPIPHVVLCVGQSPSYRFVQEC